MAKKEQQPNIVNTNVNHNVVKVNIPNSNKRVKKEKKPNWMMKAIFLALLGLAASIITIYVKNSTATNGKPAFIQNGTPSEK